MLRTLRIDVRLLLIGGVIVYSTAGVRTVDSKSQLGEEMGIVFCRFVVAHLRVCDSILLYNPLVWG